MEDISQFSHCSEHSQSSPATNLVTSPAANTLSNSSSPAGNTRSKRSLDEEFQNLPAKSKKKLSFRQQQTEMASVDNVRGQCSSFLTCCEKNCHLFMPVEVVMYCRSQFILLPDYKARGQWLQQQYKRLEHEANKQLQYAIEFPGGRKVTCQTAWLFAYGIPYATHARRKYSKESIKVKSSVSDDKSSAALTFIAWLRQFADKVGDKLPFGDAATPEIRLPFPTKELVYNVYKNFVENKDTTDTAGCISYGYACTIWKSSHELQHIKLSKCKLGFSKCDVCFDYAAACACTMSIAEREGRNLEFYSHIAETKKERSQYYYAKCKSIDNPDKCISLILDSMDQRKTSVPFFAEPSKSVSNEIVLKTKLMAVKVHGLGHYLFWSTAQIAHDSNFSVECLRRAILKIHKDRGSLPPTLYIQSDNGPDMHSKQFIGFCAYLVHC